MKTKTKNENETIIFKTIVFQNDLFYKAHSFVTIVNDVPSLTIFNDDPWLTIVNDDPSLTKRGRGNRPEEHRYLSFSRLKESNKKY